MLPFLSTPQEAFVSHPWLSQPNVAGDHRSGQEVDAMRLYLYDDFNNCMVSSHRSVKTAARKHNQILAVISKRSPGAYLPLSLRTKEVDERGFVRYVVVDDDTRDEFNAAILNDDDWGAT